MKKLIVIILLSVSVQSCFNDSALLIKPSNDQHEILDTFIKTRAAISIPDYSIIWEEFSGTGPSICFMGDSRVQAFPVRLYWADRQMWNIARNGSTLYGVEFRLPLVKQFNPDIIFISVGGNDILWGKTEEWITRYGTVLDDLKTTCSRIYVTNIVPVAGYNFLSPIINPGAQVLSGELRALCAKKGVTYIDLTELEDGSGGLSQEFTYDGIHFNQQAYDLIYGIIQNYF